MASDNRTKVVGECALNVATFTESESVRSLALVLQNCPDRNAYIELCIRLTPCEEGCAFRTVDDSSGGQAVQPKPIKNLTHTLRDSSTDHALRTAKRQAPPMATSRLNQTHLASAEPPLRLDMPTMNIGPGTPLGQAEGMAAGYKTQRVRDIMILNETASKSKSRDHNVKAAITSSGRPQRLMLVLLPRCDLDSKLSSSSPRPAA